VLVLDFFLQTYGPGGAHPLLPGPQDNSQVRLGIDSAESASQRDQPYVAIAVRGPASQAVDVSNWKVTSGTTTWTFPPGMDNHNFTPRSTTCR
jgi:hypothetical protein